MPSPVEVLVVSYGSAGMIARLLASLRAHLPDAPVAIREHAADSGPVDALMDLAAQHSAPVRVDHDPTNPGFAAGCNALAQGSSADYLLFLNPDTELVTWPWSSGDLPRRGAVIGPVMTEQAHQHYGRSFDVGDEIALSWLRRRPSRPGGSGYVSGAALLIDRHAFEAIGGFDDGFFLFYEDIDLCLRANAAGYPTLVDERWRVRHARHHSTAERFGESLVWSYESAIRFHAKYGHSVLGYRAYKAADALLRAVAHGMRGERAQVRGYLTLAGIASGLRPRQ